MSSGLLGEDQLDRLAERLAGGGGVAARDLELCFLAEELAQELAPPTPRASGRASSAWVRARS